MKVKLKKRKNYYQLVVDDPEVNKKYNCSQKEPVVLAVLDCWEGTKCWSLRDIRLEEHIYPSKYLEGSSFEMYLPDNTEQEKLIIAVLNKYDKREDRIVWNSFNGIVGGGDKTDDPTNPSYVDSAMKGAWSFDKGLDNFNNIRQFWESFEGDDIKSTKIPNPYKQPNSMMFSVLFSMLEMDGNQIGNSPQKIIKKWQKNYNVDQSIIDSLDYEKLVAPQESILETKAKKPKMK